MKKDVYEAFVLAKGAAILSGVRIAEHPKLLMPFGGRTLLEHQGATLAAAGVKKLIVVLGHDEGRFAPQILERMRPFVPEPVCLVQEEPRGTAGTLREYEQHVEGSAFWVLSGDLFIQARLDKMLGLHLRESFSATVAGVPVEDPPWELERVSVDPKGQAKTIERLYRREETCPRFRPVGLYLFDRSVMEKIPPGRYFDIKEQLLAALYRRGCPTGVWTVDGYCSNVMTLEGYRAVTRDVLFGHLSSPAWPNLPVIQDADLTPSTISPTAMVMDPLFVGEGSSIGSQTVVMGPTFIGSQCVIGEKSVVNDCIVMSHARIGAHVHLNGCVVGEGVTIEDNAEHMGVVLAKGHRHKTVKVPYLNAASEGRERPALSSVLGFTRTYPIGKRVFDIFAASVGLILSAPLMLIIAVVLKAADGGPVLFKQRRCTQYGRFFEMYKFRTMVVDAEEIRATMQCLNEVDGPMFKIADDPRVTPIGVVLRRTYLDELPQLWNVLRGDMALVGPRPLSMSEMSLNPRWRDFRLAVRPGLTGLWQVESHSKSSFAEWIRHDIHYVCNFSPWLDLKILLKTALNVFKSLFLRSSKPSGDARTVTGEVSGSEDRTPPLENVQFELSEMTHEEKAVIPAAGDLTGRELAQGPSRTDNAYRGRIL